MATPSDEKKGAKFYPITVEEMDEFAREHKLLRLPRNQLPGQSIYYARGLDQQTRLVLMSSVNWSTGVALGSGETALRVFIQTRRPPGKAWGPSSYPWPGKKGSGGNRSKLWTKRTEGWRENLFGILLVGVASWLLAPPCSKCGSKTAPKSWSGGTFWGCSMYPLCEKGGAGSLDVDEWREELFLLKSGKHPLQAEVLAFLRSEEVVSSDPIEDPQEDETLSSIVEEVRRQETEDLRSRAMQVDSVRLQELENLSNEDLSLPSDAVHEDDLVPAAELPVHIREICFDLTEEEEISRPSPDSVSEMRGFGLNANQIEAVMHEGGGAVVRAAAGAGKSRIVALRVARLVEEGVNPRGIFVTSFSKRAVNEIADRIKSLVPLRAFRGMTIMTTHSFCYKTLLQVFGTGKDGWDRLGNILGTHDTKRQISAMEKCYFLNSTIGILKSILGSGKPTAREQVGGRWMDYDVRGPSGEVLVFGDGYNLYGKDVDAQAFQSAIGLLHGDCVEPWDSREDMLKVVKRLGDLNVDALIHEVYPAYERAKELLNVIDFQDMLTLFRRHVIKDSGLLAHLRGKFTHGVVDEAQDFNYCQLKILEAVFQKGREPGDLMFVFDAMQSCYPWRGARPDVVNLFSQKGGVRDYPLGVNYRSKPIIVKLSDRLRKAAKDPMVVTGYVSSEEDGSVELHQYSTSADEAFSMANRIYNEVESFVEDGGDRRSYPYSDHMVLARTNALCGMSQVALLSSGIPTIIPRSASFFDRPEVKALVAYFKVIRQLQLGEPVSGRILSECANYPNRKLGGAFSAQLAKSRRCGIELCYELASSSSKYRKAADLADLIVRSAKDTNDQPLLLKRSWAILGGSILTMLIAQAKEKGESGSSSENISMFSDIVSHFRWDSIDKFLEVAEMASRSQVSDDDDRDVNAVVVSTLHSIKGAQAPVVHLLGCAEGMLPHAYSLEMAGGWEEELCLFYVGVTRPERRLHISWSLSYPGKQTVPSSFLRVYLDEPHMKRLVDMTSKKPLDDAESIDRDSADIILCDEGPLLPS